MFICIEKNYLHPNFFSSVVGSLAQNFNFVRISQQQQLPNSLKELADDARLDIFQIKTRFPLRVEHNELCSLVDCTTLTRPVYYRVNLRNMNPGNWGGVEVGDNFDIGVVFSKILHHCNTDQTLECFLHLLRSPWFKNYDITKVLFYLKPYYRRQFYHFLTQRLIHLCQERSVQSKNSSQQLPRWPCITFLTFKPSEEIQEGIYFLYTPHLDIVQENIKVTLFEPVLSYLTCLINTCPARRESFCAFMNVQKHFGIFSPSQHNHAMLDSNWKFFFPTNDFLLQETIDNERTDLICNCFSCTNSTVIPTTPRFMQTDYKSVP